MWQRRDPKTNKITKKKKNAEKKRLRETKNAEKKNAAKKRLRALEDAGDASDSKVQRLQAGTQ
eukprot:436009-Rhodomonas_salina.1